LVLLSFATTVIVFAPELSAIDWLQFAVPDPTVVPPLAAAPLTVTDDIPLFPNPESLAVPDIVTASYRLTICRTIDHYIRPSGVRQWGAADRGIHVGLDLCLSQSHIVNPHLVNHPLKELPVETVTADL